MKFLHKVFSFFRKPAVAEEVAKGFEQAYQKQQQEKEMDALLDWVEHDKPQTISGVNSPAIWFEEVESVISFEGAVTSEDHQWHPTWPMHDPEIKAPNYNHQLCIRKYKSQKKNWGHWKKGARK